MSRFPFTSYPNGWFVVAFSDELLAGQVLNRHYFGQDIVLYRTAQGEAHAIHPYCPHLGAHLGHGGTVVEETLRCPFHGWCFDPDGRCVSVPGLAHPPRIPVKHWHLHEASGIVYVYHHARGAAPDWRVPPVETEGWSADRRAQWRLRTHPQEILENGFDIAHFKALHGIPKYEILQPPAGDGPAMRMQIGYEGAPEETICTAIEMYGLGIFLTEVRRVGYHDRQRFYSTPVDCDFMELRAVHNIRALPDLDETAHLAEDAFQGFVEFLKPDFPIWENKRYIEHPPLTPADGPIQVLRTWTRQFYDA